MTLEQFQDFVCRERPAKMSEAQALSALHIAVGRLATVEFNMRDSSDPVEKYRPAARTAIYKILAATALIAADWGITLDQIA